MKFFRILVALFVLTPFSLADQWTEGDEATQSEPPKKSAKTKRVEEPAAEPALESGDLEITEESGPDAGKTAVKEKEIPTEPAPEATAEPEIEPEVAETSPEKSADAKKEEVAVEEDPAPVEESVAAEDPPSPPSAGDIAVHTVVKGDTLWDIAGHYYNDPFNWPQVWQANRAEIRNPDLIYPDQRFNIPAKGAAASAPAPEATPEAAPEPKEEAKTVAESPESNVEENFFSSEDSSVEGALSDGKKGNRPSRESAVESGGENIAVKATKKAVQSVGTTRWPSTNLGSDTFVAGDEWAGDGVILRDRDQKILISQDDVIYVNIGASGGIRPGMRGAIYRRGGHIRDPRTREGLGFAMKRVGTIQVTDLVGDETATAVIVTSYEPVKIGDMIQLYR